MAEHAYLSEVDPEFAPLLAKFAGVPQVFEVVDRRERFKTVFHGIGGATYKSRAPNELLYRVANHAIEVKPGVTILARNVVPTSADKKTYPLLVWFHGGGWMCGDVDTDDLQLRAISHDIQIATLNVEYRLAPEHPHPTQVNDCFAAVKWAAKNADILSADLTKGFILGGLSAGGHLAAVVAHRVRDDPFFRDYPVTGHVLQFPALLHSQHPPEQFKDRLLSWEQNKDAPLLNMASIVWYWSQLLDGATPPTDPQASPLLYPSHTGLPPVVIQIAGLDPLRDEDMLYAELLRKAGVRTRTFVYPGVPHAFNYLSATIKSCIKYEEDYRDGLRWLLAGAPE